MLDYLDSTEGKNVIYHLIFDFLVWISEISFHSYNK